MNEQEKPRRRATLAASIILVVVIAASLVAAAYLRPNSAPATSLSTRQSAISASTAQTNVTTVSITSRPLPCSAPGVQCGSLNVSSISLTAASSPHQNSTLTAVVTNTGNVAISQIMFYLNGTLVDSSQGIPIGNTVTYNVQIQPSFTIVSGQTYKVDVDSSLSGGGAQDGGAKEIFVTAQ